MRSKMSSLLSLTLVLFFCRQSVGSLLDDLHTYEIVEPEHLSLQARSKRDLSTKSIHGHKNHIDETRFRIKTSTQTFHIQLERNRDLLPEHFKVWLQNANGLREDSGRHEHCYYHGELSDDVGSRVCMSTCDGLEGSLTTSSGDQFLISPVTNKFGERQHIIYREEDFKKERRPDIPLDLHDPIRPPLDTKRDVARNLSSTHRSSRKRRAAVSELAAQYEKQTKYIETVMVADYLLFMKYKGKVNTVKRLLQIANSVDEVYFFVFKTRYVVSQIIVQETLDAGFPVPDTISKSLSAFHTYNEKTLKETKRWLHDTAQLISGKKFPATSVGLAYLNAMCTYNAVSVVEDFDRIGAINAASHELGHNLGFSHNGETGECACTEKCVMDKSGYSLMKSFSTCNIKTFNGLLQAGRYACLLDYPTAVYSHQCGDGIVASHEECDCGSVEECKSSKRDHCCEATTCKLKTDKHCAHGPCCKEDCTFVKQGTECRAKDIVCDLPEFCNGKSNMCPHNLYEQDGTPCQAGADKTPAAGSYCYEGQCNTLQKACKSLYGADVDKGVDFCTTENNIYGDTEFANCGPTGKSGTSFTAWVACAETDQFCGKLWCSRKGYITGKPNLRTQPYYSYCVASSWNSKWYDTADPTFPKDGTKCADGKVCVAQKCKSFTELKVDTTCSSKCANGGKCNTNGECDCPSGYACPYCEKAGPGGSFSSGAACSSSTDCVDVLKASAFTCVVMKLRGDCKKKVDFMRVYCRKTCDLCEQVEPVNGKWSDWSTCGTCDKTCGGGQCAQIRHCNNPQPKNGGDDCEGKKSKFSPCNTNECPVHGKWGEWSACSACDVTCGSGSCTKTRTCSEPKHGGNPCVGVSTVTVSCETGTNCPVHGKWGEWSACSTCDVTCGSGSCTKTRTCSEAKHGGRPCVGENKKNEDCNTGVNCPVHGEWGKWSPCSTCDVTCGSGSCTKTRTCTEPKHGGDPCDGDVTKTEGCNTGKLCPVHGTWGSWEPCSSCSATCGVGSCTKTRTCIPAKNGGDPCPGSDTLVEACTASVENCAVHGQWGEWSDCGTCDVKCGSGSCTKTRTCTEPKHGGNPCTGAKTKTEDCNTGKACPVHGQWGEWSDCGTCDVNCGSGSCTKTRTCTEPKHGGNPCTGAKTKTEDCNTGKACPVHGTWSTWTDCGTCTSSCGPGSCSRSRTCTEPKHGGEPCGGASVKTEDCNMANCPVHGKWGAWSECNNCTVTCGSGSCTRTRTCTEPQHGGNPCVGVSIVTGICDTGKICPSCKGCDHGKCDKNSDGSCIVYASGYWHCHIPEKVCPPARVTKENCWTSNGHLYISQLPNPEPKEGCAVNGQWGIWEECGPCSSTCGVGTCQKERSCDSPSPSRGGLPCSPESGGKMTEACDTKVTCPVDGVWSKWGSCEKCSVTCGVGECRKQRSCDAPAPEHGGKSCVGPASVDEECNTKVACPVVNGAWGEWSACGSCSKTCGNSGLCKRKRSCDSPLPSNGGTACVGEEEKAEICGRQECPACKDNNEKCLTAYKSYCNFKVVKETCPLTCGICTCKDTSAYCSTLDKAFCSKEHKFYDWMQNHCCKSCQDYQPHWSPWTQWSTCSKTCDYGTHTRTRTCLPDSNSDCSKLGTNAQAQGCRVQLCTGHTKPGEVPQSPQKGKSYEETACIQNWENGEGVDTSGNGSAETNLGVIPSKEECYSKCKEMSASDSRITAAAYKPSNQKCICEFNMKKRTPNADYVSKYLSCSAKKKDSTDIENLRGESYLEFLARFEELIKADQAPLSSRSDATGTTTDTTDVPAMLSPLKDHEAKRFL